MLDARRERLNLATCAISTASPAQPRNRHLFDAIVGSVGNAGMGEVYPGRTGLVVANGELRSMT